MRTCIVLLLFVSLFGKAQNLPKKENKSKKVISSTVMFYNTENLFDYFDDPLIDDKEFLPTGRRHWTKERYLTKLNNLSRLILSTGIEPPAIIGMAEVENAKVLHDLTQETALEKFGYKIIHFESPDARGIDVAAIYREDKLKVISSKAIEIVFPKSPKRKTRDILYIKALLTSDTIHFFFNHWPSRRGGQKVSDPNRMLVASVLKHQIDSVIKQNARAKIVIAGDFNDEPDDESLQELSKPYSTKNANQNALVNLSLQWLKDVSYQGTHKFKGHWGVLDQFIVSPSLLDSTQNGLFCDKKKAIIFNPSFLLTDDKSADGKTTFKTYSGFKYTGGFSDHLPILLQLEKK